ncbi:MAG: pyrroline-5-carboxylate reductase [Chloroflexi bacterium]|nr:pyrroline-5-carboxylate reductase [Chloroflexota bacterium]MCC6896382.1 pyrroline-5-carboxylate reductase [Anaerolineae bacterium]
MMSLGNMTVAFIGSGVMAEAMIKGLLNDKLLPPQQIIASDPRAEHVQELSNRYGLKGTTDNNNAAQAADILVLSVKPQVLGHVMPELKAGASTSKLVLSIIAGAKIKTIADGVGNASVVRAMPNTPAQIGQGITVWTATPAVLPEQQEQARTLLGALGDQIFLDDERYLDMATALSGTGPAYVFMFMESLIDAGVHMGFSRRDAERLVLQTMRGSIEYAEKSGLHPAQLRNQVTSPGGTSAEAIYHLEKGGLRTVISRAVWAAFQRSVALGGGTPVRNPDTLEGDR